MELLELHPKNVGRAFSRRLTKVLMSGIDGNAIPFPMPLGSRYRSYAATSAAPFGQFVWVSAELSRAKMTVTFLAGTRRGAKGKF